MAELSPEMLQILLGTVIALSAGVIIFLFVNPYLSGDVARDKRVQGVTEQKAKRGGTARGRDEELQNRRKQVSDTLKEIEDRQKAKEKITLRLRLQRAGLDITPKTFWIASVITGISVGIGTFLSTPGVTPLLALGATFAGVFGLPRWVLSMMTKKRQAKFTNEFANAIDVIVRGVKSGLPLNECLGIIARESPSPIKEEFQEIVEQSRVGVPLSDCPPPSRA